MKIALYLRVSTDKQETDNQALQLRDFAPKQGRQIVEEYVEAVSSSNLFDAPYLVERSWPFALGQQMLSRPRA